MTYRDAVRDRLYVCPSCGAAERAPLHGGDTACGQCGATSALPDRTTLPTSDAAFQLPPDDAMRLQHLQAQRDQPRQPSPTLQAVLGGRTVRYGGEQEAMALWQSLRVRSQQGDVAASEDLTTLTSLIAITGTTAPDGALGEALHESAYDAAQLPRHKQQHLGHLARAAIATGDRGRAEQYLSWMVPWPLELEADSELRVSAAAFATLDGDGQRVLALLGSQGRATPTVSSMNALATVLRANAYELLDTPDQAAQVLRELPTGTLLALLLARFPALGLCTRARPQHTAGAYGRGPPPVVLAIAISMACGGLALVVTSLLALSDAPAAVLGLVGAGFLAVGIKRITDARAAMRRATYVPLVARVLRASPTGSEEGKLLEYRFAVQVAGPNGPYEVSFKRWVRDEQLPLLVGAELRMWADPENLQEILYEK